MSIQFYQDNADTFFRDTVNVDMSNVYRPFVQHLKAGSRILDAGCGSGRDTKAFMDMGFTVDAFDASSELVIKARQFTGTDVQLATFASVNAVSKYDGIWCCASLLHVAADQLLSIFQKLYTALKPDGVWYFSFKYGDGERIKDGRSFTDLNEARLAELLQHLPTVSEAQTWINVDNRPGRDEKWLNAVLIKR